MVPDLQPPGIKINNILPLIAEDLSNSDYSRIINSIQYIEYNNNWQNNDISLIEISFNRLDLANPNNVKKSDIDISFILTINT